MRAWLAGFAALTLLATSGCATVLAGGPSNLELEVENPPPGVTVVVKGVEASDEETRHEARFTRTLDRASSYAVWMTADGYQPKMAVVKMGVNPAYWLNLAPMLAVMFAGVLVPGTTLSTGSLTYNAGLLASCGAMMVDLLTKNAYQHDRTAIRVRLERAPQREE